MGFKAKFKLDRPDYINATMEITMPLIEWKRLLNKIRDNKPHSGEDWDLANKIVDMVDEAEKAYTSGSDQEFTE